MGSLRFVLNEIILIGVGSLTTMVLVSLVFILITRGTLREQLTSLVPRFLGYLLIMLLTFIGATILLIMLVTYVLPIILSN